MLCDDCNKNPATIFFKDVLPDKTVELHLCEHCAQKRGLSKSQKLSPIEILQKLLQEKNGKDEETICPVCYLSLAEFKRNGRFGCSNCLNAFSPYIKNLIKQIHQSDRHIGRRIEPGENKGIEIFKLHEELKQALENEAYEEAAKIRDRLKQLGVDNGESDIT